MMLFRIASIKFINDLSGMGARINGGRWNHKGTGVIYASQSRALATLEYLVHATMPAIIPDDVSIIQFNIPDKIIPLQTKRNTLPNNWQNTLPSLKLKNIGTEWVLSKKSLLLQVPSAIIDKEFNMLINPEHPDMKYIKLSKPETFILDKRLSYR
jgi:RES domain-containing protein